MPSNSDLENQVGSIIGVHNWIRTTRLVLWPRFDLPERALRKGRRNEMSQETNGAGEFAEQRSIPCSASIVRRRRVHPGRAPLNQEGAVLSVGRGSKDPVA